MLLKACDRHPFFLESMYEKYGSDQTGLIDFVKNISHIENNMQSNMLFKIIKSVLNDLDNLIISENIQDKDDYLSRAVDFIHNNLSDTELSIVKVAQSLYLNPIYFGRVFKKMAGKSFREFLMEKRLEKAKLLLETTNKSVTSVCYDVGINSISYFSVAYKKHFGMLPSETVKATTDI